jgi:hypothetical protein
LALRSTTRRARLKNAILASFCEPAPVVAIQLGEFTERDWQRTLRWLDLSGLALYLLDRLTSLGLQDCLPNTILERLQKNLADNRDRSAALFKETFAITSSLKRASVSFALLKGITLSPESVPDISLRCQMDIDILIRSSNAFAARDILLGYGYVLDSVKGQEWSFTAGVDRTMKMNSLYKVRPQRMVELHLHPDLLPASDQRGASIPEDRLARARPRLLQGVELPALSPPDLFVQQALHIFNHLCSEHTRAQWLLEFWRHVLARHRDAAFWKDVESIAGDEPRANLAVGAVTLLATLLFGDFAPRELTHWSLDCLPRAARLWIETYGRQVLLADHQATKLYMFLRQQLRVTNPAQQASRWRFLLPFHWWPVRITHGPKGERFPARLLRYRFEVGYALRRLQFHLRTSVPYAIESRRWRRILADTGP